MPRTMKLMRYWRHFDTLRNQRRRGILVIDIGSNCYVTTGNVRYFNGQTYYCKLIISKGREKIRLNPFPSICNPNNIDVDRKFANIKIYLW